VSIDERPEELRTKVFGERTVYDNPRVGICRDVPERRP
jgi:hypothetical protein